MGVLSTYGPNALKYWSQILASAYQNASTADMWTSIRQQQAEYGLTKPGASAPDVSVLRGYANRIVAAQQALNSGNPTDAITSDMMAVAPYTAGDLNSIAVNPTYMVRYSNTVQADDGTITNVWQTSVFTSTDMKWTIGELTDAVQTDATELAASGGGGSSNTPKGTSLGVSQLEITLV